VKEFGRSQERAEKLHIVAEAGAIMEVVRMAEADHLQTEDHPPQEVAAADHQMEEEVLQGREAAAHLQEAATEEVITEEAVAEEATVEEVHLQNIEAVHQADVDAKDPALLLTGKNQLNPPEKIELRLYFSYSLTIKTIFYGNKNCKQYKWTNKWKISPDQWATQREPT